MISKTAKRARPEPAAPAAPQHGAIAIPFAVLRRRCRPFSLLTLIGLMAPVVLSKVSPRNRDETPRDNLKFEESEASKPSGLRLGGLLKGSYSG